MALWSTQKPTRTERMFLNPELDPAFFYKNVKALALLFDRLIIWSPNLEAFETAGFDVGDLVTAFTQPHDGDTVLVPAGRQRFFTPDQKYAPKDPTFRRIMEKEANVQGTVLPLTAHEDFYDMMRLIAKDHSHRFQPVFEDVSRNFNTQVVNPKNAQRVREISKLQHVPFAYAHVAEFLMEMRVCADLGQFQTDKPAVRHLVDSTAAEGYRMLATLAPHADSLRETAEVRPSDYDPLALKSRDNREERMVVEHVSRIFGAQTMSWKEVLEIRRQLGADIKEVYGIQSNDDNPARNVPAEVDLKIAHLRLLRTLIKEGSKKARKEMMGIIDPNYGAMTKAMEDATRAFEHDLHDAEKFGKPAIEYVGMQVGGQLGTVIFDAAKYYMGVDELISKAVMSSVFRFGAVNRIALHASQLKPT